MSWGRLSKILLLVASAIVLTGYIEVATFHELKIPQNEPGELVERISESELQDSVNEVFKVPLSFFPREICLTNLNRVSSGVVKIYKAGELSDAGNMRLYVEKENAQVVEKLEVPVGSTLCRPVKLKALEGATTTAYYFGGGYVELITQSDGTKDVVGAQRNEDGTFTINFNVNTDSSILWVHLTPTGHILLILFSLIGVATFVLVITDIYTRTRKFIVEDQFFQGF